MLCYWSEKEPGRGTHSGDRLVRVAVRVLQESEWHEQPSFGKGRCKQS